MNAQLKKLSVTGILKLDELEADLEATLFDCCDDLASWAVLGNQMTSDAKRIMPGNRLLYIYMDRSTIELCVKEQCLVYNSSDFGSMITSLPPYLPHVSGEELCNKLHALGNGSLMIKYSKPASNAYFVVMLPSNYFERAGVISVLTVGGSLLAFDVFALQRQAYDLNADCFKYDIVSAGSACSRHLMLLWAIACQRHQRLSTK